MDTKKDNRITKADSLCHIDQNHVVVGAKQLKRALVSGKAKRVYLAQNADPALTEPLEALCRQACVEYVWVRSMTELGHACGIEVGAAAAAVTG